VRSRRPLLFFFFLISGTSGLVFEVIWSRMLMQVFGSTTFALSALLTAFMAGLALGSEIGGRYAKRLRRPLRWYGLMELGIGGFALLVPIVLEALPALYAPLFQHLYDDFYVFSLLRFAMVFLVLLVPTTCMGATLPFLTEFVARQGQDWESSAGLLYGTNTIGACIGTAASGFFLLPALGLRSCNMVFAAVSIALCIVVVATDARWNDGALPVPEKATAARPSLSPQVKWVLACFAVAGGVSMTYQVLWTRAYVMVLGSSTYSFTVILATFLVGLAGGSAIMSALLRRVRDPLFLLALTQAGVCLAAAMCFWTLGLTPGLLFEHLRSGTPSPASVWTYGVGLVALVVLVPTLLQGAAFPLAIRVVSDATPKGESGGGIVGRTYAINTVGAIVGSFASGFVLMPLLGLRSAMMLTLGVNFAAAAVLGVLSLRERAGGVRVSTFTGLALACVAAVVLAPELDLARLSSGAFRVYWSREVFTRKSFERDRPEMVFYRDGVAATISVERRGRLLTLKANGKPEASNDADMATQILVGLLPFVLHETTQSARAARKAGTYRPPRTAAMVGFGSGVTAGAALTWPLERLDVVEIEAAMLDASRAFDPYNHAALDDPRIRVVESDGRNFLEYTGDQYDVIVSEPSNPWIAGVASLFTREHFLRARRKLAPGGVFCQWVQLYEMRPENVARVIKTFRAAFPHSLAFSSQAKGTDLVLIGSEEPVLLGVEGMPAAFSDASVRGELLRANVRTPDDLYALLFLGGDEMERFVTDREAELGHEIIINTDDNGILEFEAPKDLVRYKEADHFFARIYYGDTIYGDIRPLLYDFGDEEAWTSERLARLAAGAFGGGKQQLAQVLSEMAQARGESRLARDVAFASRLATAGADDAAVVAQWPSRTGTIHHILASGVSQDSHIGGAELLYAEYPQHKDIFEDPEATLAAAWLLHRTRRYKLAHRQLTTLAQDEQFAAQTPVLHLMLGYSYTKRRRYRQALASFVRYKRLAFESPSR
jgi:spermidine synthase